MDLNEALETLIATAQEARQPKPQPAPTIHTEGERRYLFDGRGLSLVKPPRPRALEVNSLDALVRYIIDDVDDVGGAEAHGPFVHIAGPREVRVVTKTDGYDAERSVLARATPPVDDPGPFFGRWHAPDEFVTRLQTHFGEDDAGVRKGLLEVVGTLQAEEVKSVADDGYAQEVTAKKGVKPRAERVQNPYRLVAFRSFPEVELDPQPFVLRLRGGGDGLPQVALFEADGGRWVLDALAKVKAYLEPKLAETETTIIC